MGLFYSTGIVLGNFNAFNPILLAAYGVTFLCFVIYYAAAIVRGFKDKHAGMPWQTNMWNMSNDFCFVFLGFSSWWTPGLETNHWFTHIIWIGMVFWFAAEIIVHYQACKWDLKEIFPNLDKRSNGIILYLLAQVVFVAAYYWMWSAIADPLVQIMIATTIAGCTVFVPEMLRDRGSVKGISEVSLWAVLVAQIAWWFFAMGALDPNLANIYTYFFGICVTGVGIASLVKYRSLKRLPENGGPVHQPSGLSHSR